MRKSLLTNIIGIILDILLCIVSIMIIIGIYYIFQVKILSKDYVNIFGYSFFEVASGSMSPTLEIGDVIFVKLTNEIEENDIILYSEGNSFITHRLIKKEQDRLIAKGDANNSEDKPIKKEQVLGKVGFIVPRIGIWKKIILQPEVIGLTISFLFIFGITFVYTSSKPEVKDE